MLIVDAHQDLAWNMLTFGRDYTKSALQIRRQEQGTLHALYNDDTLLGWPEYQRGQVALIFRHPVCRPDALLHRRMGQAVLRRRAPGKPDVPGRTGCL